MNIATIKRAAVSLKGDTLTMGALRLLVQECDGAHVPDSASVVLASVQGATSATVVWTLEVSA